MQVDHAVMGMGKERRVCSDVIVAGVFQAKLLQRLFQQEDSI